MLDRNDEGKSGNTAVPLVVALLAVFTIGYWLVTGGPSTAANPPYPQPHSVRPGP